MARVVAHYVPLLRMAHPDDYPKRERDLEHLVAIAGRYRTLGGMLADMALEPPADSVGGGALADRGEADGLLTLSTIHSAKGLEWRAVFVIWLVDGRFPPYANLTEAEIEEERRLLYVACTRAKDLLHLTYPIDVYDRVSGVVLGRPSRFLGDLPSGVLETVSVVEGDGGRP
jgi:DNA helicase-2/ATP-dependent DNA helicase PcrA